MDPGQLHGWAKPHSSTSFVKNVRSQLCPRDLTLCLVPVSCQNCWLRSLDVIEGRFFTRKIKGWMLAIHFRIVLHWAEPFSVLNLRDCLSRYVIHPRYKSRRQTWEFDHSKVFYRRLHLPLSTKIRLAEDLAEIASILTAQKTRTSVHLARDQQAEFKFQEDLHKPRAYARL